MQGVAGVLVELTQEVQELEESITNKVHQLIAGMTAVEHVQGAEEHLQRLEESVEGIRGLVEGLTGIRTLDLRHCMRITCRSMYHIRQLQHLHTLNLAWVADSAADSAPGERWIRALGPMEELAWLSLFGWRLRDEGALCVARFFPNLRALRCSAGAGGARGGGSGGGLTKGGVRKMVKLPRLGKLWLLGGSEEVRKAVRKDRPWVTVLC
ncbi:unnamed protein product [Closterium sp. Yama58-4]|nr:unnamed protein product [Closterium sp. Yama58-4]